MTGSDHQPSGEDKGGCPRCKRTRWVLTILMLAIMAYILYADQLSR